MEEGSQVMLIRLWGPTTVRIQGLNSPFLTSNERSLSSTDNLFWVVHISRVLSVYIQPLLSRFTTTSPSLSTLCCCPSCYPPSTHRTYQYQQQILSTPSLPLQCRQLCFWHPSDPTHKFSLHFQLSRVLRRQRERDRVY